MSSLAQQSDHPALRPAARRSAAGRFRHANDGALTEMARSLLRDARESRDAGPGAGAHAALRTRPGAARPA
jgi:hypothetical protein